MWKGSWKEAKGAGIFPSFQIAMAWGGNKETERNTFLDIPEISGAPSVCSSWVGKEHVSSLCPLWDLPEMNIFFKRNPSRCWSRWLCGSSQEWGKEHWLASKEPQGCALLLPLASQWPCDCGQVTPWLWPRFPCEERAGALC